MLSFCLCERLAPGTDTRPAAASPSRAAEGGCGGRVPWHTPGEPVLGFGLTSVSVPPTQAGACPCWHSGSSGKHGPWEVLLLLNGRCLSLWAETATTLDQPPSHKSWLMVCCHAFARNARRPHGRHSVLSLHVYPFRGRIYTLIKKKSLLETVY